MKIGNKRKGYTLAELLAGLAVGLICLSAIAAAIVCFSRMDGRIKKDSADMYAVEKIRYYMIENADSVTDGLIRAEGGKIINSATGAVIAEGSGVTDICVFYEYPSALSSDEQKEENAIFKRCKIVCGSNAYNFIIKAY